MLSCSIWFSAPKFWMGGGLESRCVGRVYGEDGAVHNTTAVFVYCTISRKFRPSTLITIIKRTTPRTV